MGARMQASPVPKMASTWTARTMAQDVAVGVRLPVVAALRVRRAQTLAVAVAVEERVAWRRESSPSQETRIGA